MGSALPVFHRPLMARVERAEAERELAPFRPAFFFLPACGSHPACKSRAACGSRGIDGYHLRTRQPQAETAGSPDEGPHSHVRHYQMQASEFVAFEQALVLGSFGQGRRRGRRNDD